MFWLIGAVVAAVAVVAFVSAGKRGEDRPQSELDAEEISALKENER